MDLSTNTAEVLPLFLCPVNSIQRLFSIALAVLRPGTFGLSSWLFVSIPPLPEAAQHLSGRKGDYWLYFFEGKFPLSLPHELGMLVRASNLSSGEVEAGRSLIPKATE